MLLSNTRLAVKPSKFDHDEINIHYCHHTAQENEKWKLWHIRSNNQLTETDVVILTENPNRLYKAGIYIHLHTNQQYTKCNTDTINPDLPFCLYISSNFPEVNQHIIDTSTSLEHVYQNNPYSTNATSNPHNQKQLCNLHTFTSTQQNGINN